MSCYIEANQREDLVRRFLTEDLSDIEYEKFVIHLPQCAACEKELILQDSPVRLIEEAGDILLATEDLHSNPWWQKLADYSNRLRSHMTVYPLRAAASVTMAAIVIIFSGLALDRFGQPPPISQQLIFTNAVPYAPSLSAWKGADSNQEEAHQNFLIVYRKALDYYQRRAYPICIMKLEEQEIYAKGLAESTEKGDQLLASEYYFYLGVSQFAQNINAMHKKPLDREAWIPVIETLRQSLQSAVDASKSKREKNRYFFGLANGYAGNYDEAISQLRDLDRNDKDLPYIDEFIEEWQDKQ